MADDNSSNNDPLKIQLKTVVKKTNGVLGDLEDQWTKTMEPFQPTIDSAKSKLTEASKFTKDVYERRHEYGGLLTAGAAGVAGTTTFLRRWRLLPAATSAVVAGTVTYGLVYGLDEIFESETGKPK